MGAWAGWLGWGLALAMSLLLATLLVRASQREARLVRAMGAAEQTARIATAREAIRTERERFSKGLALSLQRQETLEDFGTTLLDQLSRRIDARAAAFHRFNPNVGAYVLTARYAGNTSPAFVEAYQPGEGVAGQAVLDRRRLVCEGAATDWMWVASGTQVSAALTVIVEPILSGDQVPGVLELALMRPEDNATLALLDEIMPVVALSLEALAARLRTQTEFARHLQELEQCDRQLQDSERRLRTLFETANEGIWIIDAATQTTDLNPAMAAILGLPREAVLGRPIFEFVDAANEAIFREQLKHRQQGETGAYEIALSRPDGSQIPCLFSASPLFNARGERVGSFAMVTDRMFSRGAGVG